MERKRIALSKEPLTTAVRYAKSVIRQKLGAVETIVSYDEDRSRIVVRLDEPSGLSHYRYRSLETDAQLMGMLLSKGDVAVDGGTHQGLFTLVAAERVGPKGCVIGFEPSHAMRAVVSRNCRLNNYTWVDIRPDALHSDCGETNFVEFDGATSGFSSFAPPTHLGSGRVSKVTLVKLDDAVEGIAPGALRFVKLDLEGAEHAALVGASRLLKSGPNLLIEVERDHLHRQGSSPEEIFRLLTRAGYELFGIRSGPRGQPILTRNFTLQRNTPNVFASVDANWVVRRGVPIDR